MNTTAFLLLRLAIGASMFGHGLVRLPKLNAFSSWMTGNFENTLLPQIIVLPFSYVLPIAEFGIGLLLLLGLFTKTAATLGAIVMILLLIGTALIENWEAIPSQLIHVLFFALLLQFTDRNTFAMDMLIKK
ncbi:DoxX family membrane protein [Flavobacterium sp. UBA4197]|uniref:DoxX family membrane protein n=1 Tax=Flavobacterium sp. UBA4197 TaxID=1946546 RepID=UPI00258037F9|nr:DoxX family membrane protein [Flavobacterium sp. UBA4197]